MKNPDFAAQFARWAQSNGLSPAHAYPCAHSVLGRGHRTTTHRDHCLTLRRSLLNNAHLLRAEETGMRVLVCFPYAPRLHEPGHEIHWAAVEKYAALVGVQALPAQRVQMQRLFSTDSTCDLYGPLGADLDLPDHSVSKWTPTRTWGIW